MEDAHEALSAGASLLEVYTGLIYRGPSLIKELASLSPGKETL
jgi:dihydroorotate dehydrogenase